MSFTIFYNGKASFWAIKTRSSKRRKIDIFQKGLTHGFGPKMAIFPIFFLGIIRQENVFYDILEQKNAFLGYKNEKFKKSKNWHFSKGDNPWFLVQKWPSFQKIFLGTIGQENVFYDILKRKHTFLGYKNKKFKKSKNWHFSKGDHPLFLVQNWPFFQLSFFRQYWPGNCLLRYFPMEKRLSGL